MASFHNRADRHREMLPTAIALEETGTRGFAMQPGDAFDLAAMRAEGTIRPANRFEMIAGGVFVVEDWIGEIDGRHWWLTPYHHQYGDLARLCQVPNSQGTPRRAASTFCIISVRKTGWARNYF